MDKMTIYEQCREVPKDAQKPIAAGRLKGKTDINPMWRIKKLTELFGRLVRAGSSTRRCSRKRPEQRAKLSCSALRICTSGRMMGKRGAPPSPEWAALC